MTDDEQPPLNVVGCFYQCFVGSLMVPNESVIIVMRKMTIAVGLFILGLLLPIIFLSYFGYFMYYGDRSPSTLTVVGASAVNALAMHFCYWFCRATKRAPTWLTSMFLFSNELFWLAVAVTLPTFPLQAACILMAAVCSIMKTSFMAFHYVVISLIFLVNDYNKALMISSDFGAYQSYFDVRNENGVLTVPEPRMATRQEMLYVGLMDFMIMLSVVAIVHGTANEFHRIFADQETLHADGKRNTDNAPTEGEIAIMFTDIQDSTKLWGHCPLAMGAALDTHHAVIRECIERRKGFEVKTVGDSFMIAVDDPERALQLAMDIQKDFMRAKFPKAIEAVYAAADDEDLNDIVDDPEDFSTPGPAWNGLRVRIGMHSGNPDVVFDEVTKSYDYYGPMVNVSARVEATAKGGQVNCTRDFLNAQRPVDRFEAMHSTRNAYATKVVGMRELKGVPEAVEIIEVCLADLRTTRVFENKLEEKQTALPDMLAESGDPIDEIAGGRSFPTVDSHYMDYAAFLAATMAAFRKASDRELVVSMICKAWRLPVLSTKNFDTIYASIARRVGPSVKGLYQRFRLFRRESARFAPDQLMSSPRNNRTSSVEGFSFPEKQPQPEKQASRTVTPAASGNPALTRKMSNRTEQRQRRRSSNPFMMPQDEQSQ
jgi:class 3 adenylate cyclase